VVVSTILANRRKRWVISVLKEQHVCKLIDVRELPISRKKGFSKKSLASHLKSAGIEYLHLREAGHPYHQEKQDLERCLQLYQWCIETHPELVALTTSHITQQTTAILCYERRHSDCHRSILLQAMKHQGLIADIVEVN
jgi:uncharacterized protein (DUF488 family)